MLIHFILVELNTQNLKFFQLKQDFISTRSGVLVLVLDFGWLVGGQGPGVSVKIIVVYLIKTFKEILLHFYFNNQH